MPTQPESKPIMRGLETFICFTIAGTKKYKPTKPTWLRK
jgi:hypothetical protein